ncbi:MAG: type II toxin-antitoxin system ParD family antitoxin [Acetobacteraceae bacterium]|nr:type II toxin-antitoxin system ParD family antitoxin [Acetobacteraceae bacterium]
MTIPVTLPPRLEAFARQQVADGHFRSIDDVIRSALCLLEVIRRDRQLKAEWRRQEQQWVVDAGPAVRAADMPAASQA